MSEKYRVGIEVKSVDYYTLEDKFGKRLKENENGIIYVLC